MACIYVQIYVLILCMCVKMLKKRKESEEFGMNQRCIYIVKLNMAILLKVIFFAIYQNGLTVLRLELVYRLFIFKGVGKPLWKK